MKKTIAIDASPLVDENRYRGIGMVAKQTLFNAPKSVKSNYQFILYVPHEYKEDEELLQAVSSELTANNLSFEFRSFRRIPFQFELYGGKFKKLLLLPKRLVGIFIKQQLAFDRMNISEPYFIQFDMHNRMPNRLFYRGKSLLVIHDLIQYRLDADYLPSFRSTRNTGASIKASVKQGLRHWAYKRKVVRALSRSDVVLADSAFTLKDFEKIYPKLSVKAKVNYLGVDINPSSINSKSHTFTTMKDTVWGLMPTKITINAKNRYLVYIGGADSRKNIQDVLATFNILKAQGENFKLVLCGPLINYRHIPNEFLNTYIDDNPSYLDDIYFLGHVTDDEKSWLYQNAFCLLQPTKYEGFGLTNLEAMQLGCPVVTYENSCVGECCGEAALYATSPYTMAESIIQLEIKIDQRKELVSKGITQASKYTWSGSSASLFNKILK